MIVILISGYRKFCVQNGKSTKNYKVVCKEFLQDLEDAELFFDNYVALLAIYSVKSVAGILKQRLRQDHSRSWQFVVVGKSHAKLML